MKLDIGGGYNSTEGFISLDIDPHTKPDYVVDLEKDVFPFADNSVTEVKAYHILEHLGAGFFHCLQEVYRVCENGAAIDIVVPNHWHEYYMNDPTHQRPITPEGMKMFGKEYNEACIAQGSSISALAIRFDVDFKMEGFGYTIDPFYKDIMASNTEAQNQRLLRECVNVATETHIKMSVVK